MLTEELLQTDYTTDTVTYLKKELTKHAILHTYNDIVTTKKNWYHSEKEVSSKQCNDVTLSATLMLLNINQVRGYYAYSFTNTGCPTTYQTLQFFNNSKTNEDIAMRFEQEYVRCVRNEKECVCSKIMSVCVWMCL